MAQRWWFLQDWHARGPSVPFPLKNRECGLVNWLVLIRPVQVPITERRSRTAITAFTESPRPGYRDFLCSVIKLCWSTICNIRSPGRLLRYYNLLSVRIRLSDGSMCNSFSKICEWICGDLLFILTAQFCPLWGIITILSTGPGIKPATFWSLEQLLQPQLTNSGAWKLYLSCTLVK